MVRRRRNSEDRNRLARNARPSRRQLGDLPNSEPATSGERLSSSGRSRAEMIKSIEAGLVQIVKPDGSGSGFVVSQDGLIVTNAHVVGRNSSVEVKFVDGRSYDGRVLGRDDTLDLAVVQVESRLPFQPMTLGDANSVQVGDPVVALGFPLGNALGRDYTATTGMVSSLRTVGTVEQIQTDAALNPGNSGGPLVDQEGRVIGVNTWIRGDAQGIGFAVSVSEIRRNVDSLAAGGGRPDSRRPEPRQQRSDAGSEGQALPDSSLRELLSTIRETVDSLAVRRRSGAGGSEGTSESGFHTTRNPFHNRCVRIPSASAFRRGKRECGLRATGTPFHSRIPPSAASFF